MNSDFAGYLSGALCGLIVVLCARCIMGMFHYYYKLSQNQFAVAILCTTLTLGLPVVIAKCLLGI